MDFDRCAHKSDSNYENFVDNKLFLVTNLLYFDVQSRKKEISHTF